MATEIGFMQGQSDNLPKIDSLAMFSFLGDNPDFMGAEIKGIKATRSGRESYGDNAVGYVQVKRDGNICIVKAKVTPEHSVKKKAYGVVLICNEDEEKVISVQCEDCAASLGGCKHSIALLTWLHRRSEEPPKTSVECYWKKSSLASVGTTKKFIKARDLGKSLQREVEDTDNSFLNMFVNQSLEVGRTDSVLTKYFKTLSSTETLSLHYILQIFLGNHDATSTAYQFINFCENFMSPADCSEAEIVTRNQSDCSLWHELRFCRITASKAYEVMHCHTAEGSVVEAILGARKLRDTQAMKRGRQLEKHVIKVVGEETRTKLNKCGLVLHPKYPVLGASPDAISEQCVVEVKCPFSEKSKQRYITREGKISAKYLAQVQLQMHMCEKQQALFCVADEDFEESKTVHIVTVDYDEL
ncbi:hypothetical protein NQ315_012222, partial [Exocentrus adspersus]